MIDELMYIFKKIILDLIFIRFENYIKKEHQKIKSIRYILKLHLLGFRSIPKKSIEEKSIKHE
jgi:hypothetical protein